MAHAAKIVEDTLTAVEKLPLAARRQLAEKLLQKSSPHPGTIIIPFEQFDPMVEARLQYLMDRSNEGTLNRKERRELADLIREHQRIMLTNSEAILRASRPDLFDETGQLISAPLHQAIRAKARLERAKRRSRKSAQFGKTK